MGEIERERAKSKEDDSMILMCKFLISRLSGMRLCCAAALVSFFLSLFIRAAFLLLLCVLSCVAGFVHSRCAFCSDNEANYMNGDHQIAQNPWDRNQFFFCFAFVIMVFRSFYATICGH